MPAIHTQETCNWNWYQSSCTRNLHVRRSIRRPYNLYCVGADVKPCSINQVGQSGTSFFCYQFLARNRTQLYSITETARHVTRTVQGDWPASCFRARNCDELVSNFSCKFLVAVYWACVAGISILYQCQQLPLLVRKFFSGVLISYAQNFGQCLF